MIELAMWRSPSRSSSKYWPWAADAMVCSASRSSRERSGISGSWTSSPPGPRNFGIEPAAERADADRVDRDAAGLRLEDRLLDLAAPRLAVGDHHEDLRVQRLAVQLLVAFEQPDAPVDAALHVRVPGAFVLQAERRRLLQVIEEEEEGVRVFREPHLRRGDAREYRHRDAVVLPAQRVAEHAQEARRSLPAVAAARRRRASTTRRPAG